MTAGQRSAVVGKAPGKGGDAGEDERCRGVYSTDWFVSGVWHAQSCGFQEASIPVLLKGTLSGEAGV